MPPDSYTSLRGSCSSLYCIRFSGYRRRQLTKLTDTGAMEAQYLESVPHLIDDTFSRQGESQYWHFLKFGLPARDLGCRQSLRRDGKPWDLLDHSDFLQPTDVYILRRLREGQTRRYLQRIWSDIQQKEGVLAVMRARARRLARDHLDEAHNFFQTQLLKRRHAIIKLALETEMPVDPASTCAYARACADLLDHPRSDVLANPRAAIWARLQVLAPGSDIAKWTSWEWAADRDLATGTLKPVPMVVLQGTPAANTSSVQQSPAPAAAAQRQPGSNRCDIAGSTEVCP